MTTETAEIPGQITLDIDVPRVLQPKDVARLNSDGTLCSVRTSHQIVVGVCGHYNGHMAGPLGDLMGGWSTPEQAERSCLYGIERDSAAQTHLVGRPVLMIGDDEGMAAIRVAARTMVDLAKDVRAL